ncbi:NCS2 family permease [Porticoccaceae bacterium]|nr:NCS2 family permease [Porticoccaceae bacterium]
MNLDSLFKIKARGTTPLKELLAGITTWVTMVYIVAVNPHMLSDAGMDFGAVFVATCLAAAFGCLIMGAVANLPIALAPGMGLNAFFTYSIVLGMGLSWELALGAVFWSGFLFLILSLTKVREQIIYAMPESIKTGIAIGIGFFLAVIGLGNAGIIVQGQGTLVALGDVHSWSVIFCSVGFVVTVALYSKGKNWAVIFGIACVAILGWIFDPAANFESQVMSLPPAMSPTFMKLEVFLPLDVAILTVILSLLFVDIFDTSGTLVAVAKKGGLEDSEGKIENLGKAMIADSGATIAGSIFGTSTTTSYIESNAGIAAGGKTGLTAIVVALLFLLTLFFSPLAASLPSYATSPALIFVAILLIGTLSNFSDWDDFSESAPLIITALLMPLSFSIADGLAAGVITYTFVKIFSGNIKAIHPVMGALTVAFICRFVWLVG